MGEGIGRNTDRARAGENEKEMVGGVSIIYFEEKRYYCCIDEGEERHRESEEMKQMRGTNGAITERYRQLILCGFNSSPPSS